jgi:hypothetical protein
MQEDCQLHGHYTYYCFIYHYYLIELQMVFARWQWYYNTRMIQHTKIRMSHNITRHAQTKHSTQSYTNNKGHITHKEYKARKKVKLSV